MTEAASGTAAVCAATGAVATPFCVAFGFDITLLWTGMVCGLLGCIIAQTLIPDKAGSSEKSLKAVGRLMVGSSLFAGVLSMFLAPWIARFGIFENVQPGVVRFGVGAILGAMAQPLAILGWDSILKWLGKKAAAAAAPDTPKENGNA
jgi:hypothetical protein